MLTPARIVLSRRKGWRLPEGARSVARPGPWGNPFRLGDLYGHDDPGRPYVDVAIKAVEGTDTSRAVVVSVGTAEVAVAAFALSLSRQPDLIERARAELTGLDLGCWCPIERPNGTYAHCHADVWLTVCSDMSFEEVKATNLARLRAGAS